MFAPPNKESVVLKEKLHVLNSKRKNGELSTEEFYMGLMKLVGELSLRLQEEEIHDKNIRKQIPLLEFFLIDQIEKLEGRGN